MFTWFTSTTKKTQERPMVPYLLVTTSTERSYQVDSSNALYDIKAHHGNKYVQRLRRKAVSMYYLCLYVQRTYFFLRVGIQHL